MATVLKTERKNRLFLWILAGATIATVVVFILLSSNRKSRPIEGNTIVVEQVTLPVTIDASGKVVPIQTVNLSPKVGVSWLNF